MNIAISGATGFIGSYLRKKFDAFASEIFVLKREDSDAILSGKLKKADVIINLSGSTILKRWNKKNRQTILDSRINTTRRIVSVLNGLPETNEQKLFISASAIGIYPDDISKSYDEMSIEKGIGFLSEVVAKWEAEANNLVNPTIRLITVRLGLVLGNKGTFIKSMRSIFNLGLGGIVGSGNQLICFIHIEDVYRAFLFFMNTPEASGIYNLVTPTPITNKEFTKTLARMLHRPAFFRIPAFMLKLIYGEASGILLNGAKVMPFHLLNKGFSFKYPELKDALNEILTENR